MTQQTAELISLIAPVDGSVYVGAFTHTPVDGTTEDALRLYGKEELEFPLFPDHMVPTDTFGRVYICKPTGVSRGRSDVMRQQELHTSLQDPLFVESIILDALSDLLGEDVSNCDDLNTPPVAIIGLTGLLAHQSRLKPTLDKSDQTA